MEKTAAGVLRLLLIEHNGKERKLSLDAGSVHFIGRAPKSAVLIEDNTLSSQHVELSVKAASSSSSNGKSKLSLFARGVGRNNTGIRERRPDGSFTELRKLDGTNAEEVKEGSQLVVPYRRKEQDSQQQRARSRSPRKKDLPEDSKDTRTVLTVRLHTHESSVPVPVSEQTKSESKVPGGAEVPSAETPGMPPCVSNKELDLENLPDVFNPVTRTGRWRYDAKLGEGGLGVVYRAYDMTGPPTDDGKRGKSHGEVALKVLKPRSKDPQKDARFVFEMHRESQWSMWYLHNQFDRRKGEVSSLFAQYLEDHTGFSKFGPNGFDKKRRTYEAPDFDWEKDGPAIPARPYVVMELIRGEALHVVIDREYYKSSKKSGEPAPPPVMDVEEKREVLLQAARALEYLEPYNLIHRDFRGCNMHLVSRRGDPDGVQLKVLDLGVMICAEDGSQELNSNQAVQAFRRRGETEEKRRRYDWLPWEVRDGADGTGPAVNFKPPTHSFDVFSLGVLILHMLIGRTQTRDFLDSLKHNESSRVPTGRVGLDPDLHVAMLHEDPAKRPHPREIVAALEVGKPSAGVSLGTSTSAKRESSRSKSASRRKLKESNGTHAEQSVQPGAAKQEVSKFWMVEIDAVTGEIM